MSQSALAAHDHFLTLLPAIQRSIRCRLSQPPPQEREELQAEALAAAFQMCCQFAVLTKTAQPVAERWPVPYDARRVERTQRIVARVWEAIAAARFYPAPSPIA